jgi:hypothetical protein
MKDRGLRRKLTARAKQRQERVKSYWPYKCGKYCSYCIGSRTHFDIKNRNLAGTRLHEYERDPVASGPDPVEYYGDVVAWYDDNVSM